MKKNKYQIIFVLSASVLISSCAADKSETSIPAASKSITDTLGCSDIKSNIFDSFYELIDQHQKIPDSAELKAALHEKVEKLKSRLSEKLSVEQSQLLKTELDTLVELMLSEFAANPDLHWKEMIQKLIEYEMEDQSSSEIVQSTQSINQQLESIRHLGESLNLPCETEPKASPPAEVVSPTAASRAGVFQGLQQVFSTAYQSCAALALPDMTLATANVAGISRIGTHSDGIGGQRTISNLTSVQNSHYYIRGQSYDTGCVVVKNNPLIYDYGGSPKLTSNTINLFANAGSGTSVLGVDCSAYVSSAVAVAGLRYKPGLENKTIYIRQNSSKFINATNSGFSCFENVKVSPSVSIKVGDIVGVNGHVLAIDKIGLDPFGIKKIASESECQNLNYKNFDITVIQSSPSKDGIGINKYVAKDYLSESSKMRTAFVEMGKAACSAFFKNSTLKPSSSTWGFLRHKGTSECLATKVSLVGESCTRKCMLQSNLKILE